MAIPGNLLTTAMAVMPHTDVERALEMALSLDVPFWPQLPNTSYYEDMYVQAAEHFPGILLDMEKRTLRFSLEKFIDEFEDTMAHFEDPQHFDISETYSVVYHRFLSMDIYTNAEIFSSYASSIKHFIDKGGVLVWGIVPTGTEFFEKENIDSLIAQMEGVWQILGKRGIDIEHLLTRSQLSPATCCLVNPDKEKTVEKAFALINHLSQVLKEKYGIN